MSGKLKTFCVVFTITAFLFIMVNLAVAWFWLPQSRNVVYGHPVFNPAHEQSLVNVYKLPIEDIRKIIAEAWTESAWVYEPYVQFKERPREGEFVNISDDGYRLNWRRESRILEGGAGSIFLFGGSTMFGYGVRDQDTIAAHLEKILRERNPGHKASVYNFGRGYYGSKQEFLLFQSLIQRGIVPEIAIFMSGVNEHFSFCPTYSNNIANMFQIAQKDPRARVRAVLEALPVMRLLRPSYRSLLEDNKLYSIKSSQSYCFECDPVKGQSAAQQMVSNYLINQLLIRSLAAKYGIRLLFIDHPVGGYKNRYTKDAYGNTIPDLSQIIKLLDKTVDEPDELSLSGLLNNLEGDAFVDAIHYTSEANQLIAKAIARDMVRHTL